MIVPGIAQHSVHGSAMTVLVTGLVLRQLLTFWYVCSFFFQSTNFLTIPLASWTLEDIISLESLGEAIS